jgi:PAS domain S-box-containing protein
MVSSGVVITGSYNYGLVALSVLLGMSASYAAFDLGGRINAGRGWVRSGWLVGGATALGVGIWSTHFTGMLAFNLPVPVGYDWPTVFLSLLAAILASAVVLFVATRKKMGRMEALAGSVIMGAGIAGMHFIGMAAMRLPATCHYSLPLVGLAVVIAILASLAALLFSFDFREETKGTTWAKVASAAVMGVAISALHYTGMASASFKASAMPPDLSHTINISSIGITGIVIGTLIVQGAAVLTSSVDRRLAAQTFLQRLSDQHKQQSRALIDAIPQQIWSGPADGSLDFCNERWRSYMGLGLEELQGEGWQSMLHPDDREQVLRAWHESVTNGTPYEQQERHRRADGQYRWFLARGMPLRDADGRIVRWYGTNTDIEDLKRAEDARRQIEEQHRIVVETATEAVVSIDQDSQVLFVNPATTRIFGYESAELIGQSLTMVMPEFLRKLHAAGLQRYLTTGQRHINWQGTELFGLRKNGEEFPVDVSFGEVRKEGRSIFTGFIRDITERKRFEEELRRLSGQLLRLQDEERRRIARDLHDSTGQDLVALATTLSQLHASIPSSGRKLRKITSQCQALADRCVREVRTLSYVLHPPMLDEAGLEDALRHYAAGFGERTGIEVELEISPRFGRMTPEAELALFRVVQESLTNIQRHSGSLQAKIRMNRAPRKITLEVSDKGSGIPRNLRRRDRELRFSLGVGIPSMHERVRLIAGSLDIESSNSGTTVRVTVPADD